MAPQGAEGQCAAVWKGRVRKGNSSDWTAKQPHMKGHRSTAGTPRPSRLHLQPIEDFIDGGPVPQHAGRSEEITTHISQNEDSQSPAPNTSSKEQSDDFSEQNHIYKEDWIGQAPATLRQFMLPTYDQSMDRQIPLKLTIRGALRLASPPSQSPTWHS